MTPAARHAAGITIIDDVLRGAPTERALTRWARASRFAGAKDREAVRDIVFSGVRRMRSAAALGGAKTGRGIVLGLLRVAGEDVEAIFSGQGHAPPPLSPEEASAGQSPMRRPERLDYPDWMDSLLDRALGSDLERIMALHQQRAPVGLRVNLARGSRETAAQSLQRDGVEIEIAPHVATALRVTSGAHVVSQSEAYQAGLIKIQDVGSQAGVALAAAHPGQRVLDFCAGGGGKALALSDALGGLGDVTAHDAHAQRVRDLPARARRADAKITVAPTLDALDTHGYDLVFVDAPCSGSGTWRRGPDAKWGFTLERLAHLIALQREILAQAQGFVRPGGVLVYATCSILCQENSEQVAAFTAAHKAFLLRDALDLKPNTYADGFFAARLEHTPQH